MPGPVLIASYSGLLGGAERVLLDCATRLPRPALVACPRGPLADAVQAAGLRHVEIPERTLRLRTGRPGGIAAGGWHLAGLGRMAWELGAAIHRHRPAAVVAWSSRATLAAAFVVGRPPTIAVLHDLHAGPVRAAVRVAVGRVDGAVAASRIVAAQLAPAAAILHPGVDLDVFSPLPPPTGPPRALFLGALVPWKRPDLAIEIARRMPELHLTIAGEPLLGETIDLPPAANVTLAGRVDARAALADAHVLLHCADAEPFGLALVEALACGRPVVAPDGGGPREIVAGGAGRLYPPGDAAAAAAALRAVLADPDAPAAARRRAEAFDVDASAARLAEAIAKARR